MCGEVIKCSSRSCDNVPDRMFCKIPEPSDELHISMYCFYFQYYNIFIAVT